MIKLNFLNEENKTSYSFFYLKMDQILKLVKDNDK